MGLCVRTQHRDSDGAGASRDLARWAASPERASTAAYAEPRPGRLGFPYLGTASETSVTVVAEFWSKWSVVKYTVVEST
jgi:hypothetical protein